MFGMVVDVVLMWMEKKWDFERVGGNFFFFLFS